MIYNIDKNVQTFDNIATYTIGDYNNHQKNFAIIIITIIKLFISFKVLFCFMFMAAILRTYLAQENTKERELAYVPNESYAKRKTSIGRERKDISPRGIYFINAGGA